MKNRELAGIVIGATLGANIGKIIGWILWIFVWGDGIWPAGAMEMVDAMNGILGSMLLSTIFAILGGKVNQRFSR